jgi:hypothetical protein
MATAIFTTWIAVKVAGGESVSVSMMGKNNVSEQEA